MARFSRVIKAITNWGGYISGWLVFAMMAVTVFEVFMRYVVRQPPLIADELAGYMLVIVSFIGTAYAWRMGGHVRITALVDKFSTRTASRVRLITLLFAFAFAVIMTKLSIDYLMFSFKIHMTSASWIRIPQQPVQMALPVGFGLLSLWLIIEIVQAILNLRVTERKTES